MDKSKTGQHPASQDADFQPMYAMQPRYADDEISLVDLAKILIRRKVTMFVTAFAIIALALVFTQIRSERFEYVSIYEVAEKGLNTPLVSQATLISLIEESILPAIKREYAEVDLPKTEVSIPKGTLLLMLKTTTTEANKGLSAEIHRKIYSALQQYEIGQITRTKENIRNQLANVNELIEEVSKAEMVPTELLAGYLVRKHSLEDQLDQLREPKVSAVASNNGKVSKFSNKLILALGIVLGSIMGIMAAFMKEFVTRVKESLQADAA